MEINELLKNSLFFYSGLYLLRLLFTKRINSLVKVNPNLNKLIKQRDTVFVIDISSYMSRVSLTFLMMFLPGLTKAEPLQQLVMLALADHPAIQAQQSQKEASEAGVESAKWQFYPTPVVSMQSHYGSPKDRSYHSNPAVDEIRQTIALQVVQSNSDWLATFLKTQDHDKNMLIYERLREMVRRRVEQGASSESDLVLIVSRIESLIADKATANAQMNALLGRLGQLMDRNITNNELSNSITESYPLNDDLQVMLDQAKLINPSIQKAKALAMVQEAIIEERRSSMYPDLAAGVEEQIGNISYVNSGARAQYQAALDEVESQGRTLSTQIIADYTLASLSKTRLLALKQSKQASEAIFSLMIANSLQEKNLV